MSTAWATSIQIAMKPSLAFENFSSFDSRMTNGTAKCAMTRNQPRGPCEAPHRQIVALVLVAILSRRQAQLPLGDEEEDDEVEHRARDPGALVHERVTVREEATRLLVVRVGAHPRIEILHPQK